MRGFVPPVDGQEKNLQRRVADAVKAASHSGTPKYLGFFNEREQQLAQAQLNRQGWRSFAFEGGFEGAERVMLCVFEDIDRVRFPMMGAFIECPQGDTLTHRDYLGAMLGTGLERGCIGDIRVVAGGAQVMLLETVYNFLAQELCQIGRYPARLVPLDTAPQAEQTAQPPQTHRASVASLRLDAVLAAMLHKNREDAKALILSGLVQVNHLPVDSLHYAIQPQDVFSIRGQGKCRLEGIEGQSRKNRTIIQYVKY